MVLSQSASVFCYKSLLDGGGGGGGFSTKLLKASYIVSLRPFS